MNKTYMCYLKKCYWAFSCTTISFVNRSCSCVCIAVLVNPAKVRWNEAVAILQVLSDPYIQLITSEPSVKTTRSAAVTLVSLKTKKLAATLQLQTLPLHTGTDSRVPGPLSNHVTTLQP